MAAGRPRRVPIGDRPVGLGEFRFVYPPVQPGSLLPHLLQRDLTTLTAQVNLDTAEPVTRVLDDEHHLRGRRSFHLPADAMKTHVTTSEKVLHGPNVAADGVARAQRAGR